MTDLTLNESLEPNTWTAVTGLTAGREYELSLSQADTNSRLALAVTSASGTEPSAGLAVRRLRDPRFSWRYTATDGEHLFARLESSRAAVLVVTPVGGTASE